MRKSILVVSLIFLTSLTFSQNSKKRIEDNLFIEISKNKYGITDSLNNVIIPFKFDFIEYKNQKLIVRNNNLNGLLTLGNIEIFPLEYKYIGARKHERFVLCRENLLWGLSDSSGKILIPIEYKSVSSLDNDELYITENKNSLKGVYDFNGNIIIPEKYKFYTVDNDKIFATNGNNAKIIDLNNLEDSIILDEKIQLIETVRHYSMGEKFFQIVKRENKFGLINSKNETIIPTSYDEIKSSQNWKYYIIRRGKKVGLINVNGAITKEPIYDILELRKEYIVFKRQNFKDEIYAYE